MDWFNDTVAGPIAVIIGIAMYFGASAAGAEHFRRNNPGRSTPTPGAGDVPKGYSVVALLGMGIGIFGAIGIFIVLAG